MCRTTYVLIRFCRRLLCIYLSHYFLMYMYIHRFSFLHDASLWIRIIIITVIIGSLFIKEMELLTLLATLMHVAYYTHVS